MNIWQIKNTQVNAHWVETAANVSAKKYFYLISNKQNNNNGNTEYSYIYVCQSFAHA